MGIRKHYLYMTWTNIKTRCYNKNNTKYKRYGLRGITVCDRWLNSFNAFLDDMGDRPSPRHSIGRIDNDVGYTPDNCRWETPNQQANNTSKNRMITHNGETKTLSEWADYCGLKYSTFRQRITSYGWDMDKIISTSCMSDQKRYYEYNNERLTSVDIENKYGINAACFYARVNKLGWDIEKAITTPMLRAYKR